MIQTKLKGMGVALITPFKEDESVDYDALMRMVDYLLQNNADFRSVICFSFSSIREFCGKKGFKTKKRGIVRKVNPNGCSAVYLYH